jgi:hypothetical protein
MVNLESQKGVVADAEALRDTAEVVMGAAVHLLVEVTLGEEMEGMLGGQRDQH